MLHADYDTVYAVGSDSSLVNLGPIALVGDYILTNSSGKSFESIDHIHVLPLMYKLLGSGFGRKNFSIGFELILEGKI